MKRAGKLGLYCWVALAAVCSPVARTDAAAVADVPVRADRNASSKSRQRVMVGSLEDGSGFFARVVTDQQEVEAADAIQGKLWPFVGDDPGRAQGRARIALTNAEDSRSGAGRAAIFGRGSQSMADADTLSPPVGMSETATTGRLSWREVPESTP